LILRKELPMGSSRVGLGGPPSSLEAEARTEHLPAVRASGQLG
jgi:hypothetical protein